MSARNRTLPFSLESLRSLHSFLSWHHALANEVRATYVAPRVAAAAVRVMVLLHTLLLLEKGDTVDVDEVRGARHVRPKQSIRHLNGSDSGVIGWP